MRKDIKFAVTVGGILLATIVVYVIVLTSGGSSPPNHSDLNTKTVASGDGVTPVVPPTDGSPAAPATGAGHGTQENVTSSHLDKPSGLGTTPGGAVTDPRADNSSPGSTVAENSTGSLPASPAQSTDPKFDWNNALSSGSMPLFAPAEPQRTETPIVSRGTNSDVVADANAGSSGSSQPAMIDALPSTRPDTLTFAEAAPSPAVDSKMISSTAARTHVVARGENLWTIAVAVYGDGKYFNRIIAANPGANAKNLKVGKTLVIPALTATDKALVATESANVAVKEEVADTATQYKVVSGDTLEKIARKLYGKPDMQVKLYELNKSRIGPDENHLKIGWVLKLPEPPAAKP
ncbi:MAG: LysM peptidoglycan-binding domain-containing protein [Planctomycetota bacterium]|nr:LysM peptidoglycan-binding domain-containing protein [Planctomycetota bacterium]